MIMGFINNESSVGKRLLLDCNFTNAMFEGITGSGKTTCAILPNIENRIKLNHGIVVYDFKGNLHSQVKHLANKYKKLDQVIEIGKPWGKKINLCDYLTLKQIPEIIDDSSDVSDSSYWDKASKNLLENIYTIYKNLYYLKCKFESLNEPNLVYKLRDIEKPSYKNIYEIVSSVKNVSSFYMNTLHTISRISDYLSSFSCKIKTGHINEVLEIIYKHLKSLEMYKEVKEFETSGKNAIVNHLNSILNVVANKDCLNDGNLDLIKELRSSKIVIIDVSSFSENILNVLNLAIYSRLQNLNESNLTPVTIFIDEAQKILSKNYLPQTDVCRESKFEYIFATQDIVLLKNKLGDSKLYELYVNIASKYSFRSNEYLNLKRFEAVNLNTEEKILTKPLFIKKKTLFNAEYKFQELNEIHPYSNFESDSKYILKYDEKLFEDYKVLVQKENQEIVETNFIPFIEIREGLIIPFDKDVPEEELVEEPVQTLEEFMQIAGEDFPFIDVDDE